MGKLRKVSPVLAFGGLALVLAAATGALAGSGVGGVFHLGRTNSVNAQTELKGSTGASQLQVTNGSNDSDASAVRGVSEKGIGVYGAGRIGVRATSRGATDRHYGVYATANSPPGLAGYFRNTSSSATGTALHVISGGATGNEFNIGGFAGAAKFAGPNGLVGAASVRGGAGVVGVSAKKDGIGVFGLTTNADGYAAYFRNASTPENQARGAGIRALGARATGNEFDGVGIAAGGEFAGPYGVIGASTVPGGYGVFALAGANGLAFRAEGNSTINGDQSVWGDLEVLGDLTVEGAKSFKIDHPLDPANKYLVHAAIESPDMMNMYNGNVITDAEGETVVELPSYFEALNRDPRYQLTVIGSPATAYVAQEISGNAFSIQTSEPGVKVSWQVTGIRQDVYARQHPMVVEEEKALADRGRYLSPLEHGQPAELGIGAMQEQRQQAQLRTSASAVDRTRFPSRPNPLNQP